jgi:hypothetical protein
MSILLMTKDLLTNIGEELLMKQGFDGLTVTVGLYSDAADNLADSSDIGNVNSEPTTSNYSAQTAIFSTSDLSGDWGVDNDGIISFDFSDTTTSKDVDCAYIIYNFASEDAGDGGTATDHLIANPALSQTRDVGSVDTLEVAAADLSIKVD